MEGETLSDVAVPDLLGRRPGAALLRPMPVKRPLEAVHHDGLDTLSSEPAGGPPSSPVDASSSHLGGTSAKPSLLALGFPPLKECAEAGKQDEVDEVDEEDEEEDIFPPPRGNLRGPPRSKPLCDMTEEELDEYEVASIAFLAEFNALVAASV